MEKYSYRLFFDVDDDGNMQNILHWKFNLNFRAKFDLSVAGHQN